MIEVGNYAGVIVSNAVKTSRNGTAFVEIMVRLNDDDVMPLKIFLTSKTMDSARNDLKACGFNCDKEDLAILDVSAEHLKDNKVNVAVEENGKYGLQLRLSAPPITKDKMKALAQKLRSQTADKPQVDDIPF